LVHPVLALHVTGLARLGHKIAPRERESLAVDVSSDEAAIYLAMLTAGFRRKPKTSAVDYARRFTLEKLLLQRRYCNVFAQWRRCGRPTCRRQQDCRGDAKTCLKRALARVPRDIQKRARQAIIAAMPCNIGAPERDARLAMPHDLTE
jgi:hypothetical protein